MKILINGAFGRMGQEVIRLAERGYLGAELAAKVDVHAEGDVYACLDDVREQADVIIDFSHHSAVGGLLDYAVKKKIPTVVATTGHSEEERAAILEAAKSIPVFFSANMSLGIAVLAELAKTAARLFPDADIEIIEKHHNRKLDAPSGTALMLANSVREVREDVAYVYGRGGHTKREKNEIGIHAIRMGNIVGEHEILIGTDTETLTLSHTAHSRSLFADGAVVAASFICGKPAGLYTMRDLTKNG